VRIAIGLQAPILNKNAVKNRITLEKCDSEITCFRQWDTQKLFF